MCRSWAVAALDLQVCWPLWRCFCPRSWHGGNGKAGARRPPGFVVLASVHHRVGPISNTPNPPRLRSPPILLPFRACAHLSASAFALTCACICAQVLGLWRCPFSMASNPLAQTIKPLRERRMCASVCHLCPVMPNFSVHVQLCDVHSSTFVRHCFAAIYMKSLRNILSVDVRNSMRFAVIVV